MDPKRLETLAASYADGTLDEDAAAELLQAVEADPEIRRELLLHVRTDRLLRAARRVDPEPVIRAIDSRRAAHFSTRILTRISRRPPSRPAPPWILLLSVAALLLLSLAGLLTRRPSPPVARPTPIAEKPAPPQSGQMNPVHLSAPPRERTNVPDSFVRPAPAPAPLPVAPPAPPPVPVPLPAPAPEPDPKPTIVETFVAVLDGATPRNLRDGEQLPGRAVVRYPDGSRLELGEGGELRANGARIEHGTVEAVVAKQPAGRVFTISTPQAEVLVLGTRFTLRVSATSTVLEVQEGKVRLKRPDGMTVDVGANLTATAAKGVPLAARPILRTLVFQDGVSPDPSYAGTRDTTISQLKPAENRGGDAQLTLYRPVEGIETSVLRWDVSAIPPGSRIVSAELTFFVTGALSAPGWRLHELRRPWEEREATWKSPWQIAGAQGDADRGRFVATLAPTSTGSITIPLNEAVVQQWTSGANFGLVFVPAGGSARWGVESRETARPERRPRLAVMFLPPIR